MKTLFKLLCACCFITVPVVAGGRPCWDEVSPAVKYKNRHLVSGDVSQFMPGDKEETHFLSADGLNVSAKLMQVSAALMVEVVVTNCSTTSVQISPKSYELLVIGPGGSHTDKILARLDPTQFQHNNRAAYRALQPETLEYGRVGTYFLLFAPDTYFPKIEHALSLRVPIAQWKFVFPFKSRGNR